MRCHTLEKSQRIAYSVRCSRRELRWIEERVDGDDFLQEGCHDTCENRGQQRNQGVEEIIYKQGAAEWQAEQRVRAKASLTK